MNMIKKLRLAALATRYTRNFAELSFKKKSKNSFVLEPLKERELVRVKGEEVVPFLQGLLTNDISRLSSSNAPSSLYGLFLNKSGRILFDTIIYRTNDPQTFLLECDQAASPDFRRHLRTYRVRRNIEIDPVDREYVPWVIFNNGGGSSIEAKAPSQDLFVSPDPRLRELGVRVLAPTDVSWGKLALAFNKNADISAVPATDEQNYRVLRYSQGVSEGVKEMKPGKCFPLEANGDFLNGISFQKGCYVGQELTARVYHTGVIRKRHMPLRITAPVQANLVKSVAGANVGSVFSTHRDRALALLRVEQVLAGPNELMIDGDPCYVEKPSWWPSELPHKKLMAMNE